MIFHGPGSWRVDANDGRPGYAITPKQHGESAIGAMSAHGGVLWIRYGKGIRALRFEGPNSYRPLDLHVVPRSLSIRNVKEFLHIVTFYVTFMEM